MRAIFTILIVTATSLAVNAQTKKQIKDLDIKSTTIWEYDYSSGKESKKIASVEKYNNAGNVVEYIDFDKSGKQKERIVYEYNENNDIVKETYYDDNSKPDKSYKYTYQGRLRKTKEKYDSNGKLVWKKVYAYEM